MLKYFIVFCVCTVFLGCATRARQVTLERQIFDLQTALAQKDKELERQSQLIDEKQQLLADAESKLGEKDARIEQLRLKLKGFGVFE